MLKAFFEVVLACLLVCGALGVAVQMPASAATTGNSAPQAGRIVSDNPSGFTPHVMDGQVQTLAQVYLGGNFTRITSGGTSVSVSRLTKVSVATGTRDTGFSPGSYNGSIRDLELTGNRLWVAGKFTPSMGAFSEHSQL